MCCPPAGELGTGLEDRVGGRFRHQPEVERATRLSPQQQRERGGGDRTRIEVRHHTFERGVGLPDDDVADAQPPRLAIDYCAVCPGAEYSGVGRRGTVQRRRVGEADNDEREARRERVCGVRNRCRTIELDEDRIRALRCDGAAQLVDEGAGAEVLEDPETLPCAFGER
jgi:hypothetical protein